MKIATLPSIRVEPQSSGIYGTRLGFFAQRAHRPRLNRFRQYVAQIKQTTRFSAQDSGISLARASARHRQVSSHSSSRA